MSEFLKELEQLPEERQKAIKKGLQNQIVAQAEFIRDEQPTKFLAYIDEEIENTDASMLRMVQESSREGAELGAISEIYIWNKERKKALAELRDGYLQQNSQSLNPEKAATEPLQGNNRGKGRPKKPFKDLMRDDPDGCKLQKIHKLMQGKKGKGAALVILACIKKGWIDKPTHRQVSIEFGDVGVQQGFTSYLNESKFSKEELDGTINSLD